MDDKRIIEEELEREKIGRRKRRRKISGEGEKIRVRNNEKREEKIKEEEEERNNVRGWNEEIELDIEEIEDLKKLLRKEDIGKRIIGLLRIVKKWEKRKEESKESEVRKIEKEEENMVGMERIEEEVNRDLKGLVEIGEGKLIKEKDRRRKIVKIVKIEELVDIVNEIGNIRNSIRKKIKGK